METKVATALAQGDTNQAAGELVRSARKQLGGADPELVLVFCSTHQPLGQVTRELVRAFPKAVVLGCSTAGEFTEKGDSKGSVCMFALAGDYKVHAGLGKGLKANVEVAVREAVAGLPHSLDGYPYRTALLLLDPLAGNSEEATLLTSELLGGGIRLAGGAAGDDLQMKECWVARGSTSASDAVVVATIFSKAPLGVGVCHGHKPLSEPLKVTRASANLVYEIEGKPAWQVWEQHTRASAEKRGVDPAKLNSSTEVGGFLLRYEAGLAVGKEYKIRAPLSRNPDGSIAFACGIPQGTVIRIMEGEPESQINSAREAARRARQQIGGVSLAGAVVFDCICRKLILGDDFQKAVKSIYQELGKVPMAGFETYGEIALDAGDMSGFHNTTSVVLAFPA